jgi:hypothetical protein
MRQGFVVSTVFQYSTEILRAKRQEKVKGIQVRKEEVNFSMFVDDMTLYLKD